MKKSLHVSLFLLITLCAPAKTNGTQAALHAPITLNPNGISHFLQTTFNTPEYTHDVLPYTFDHITQLLEHGNDITKHKRSYLKSVIRLFNNKMKEVECINAYAFASFLKQLPAILHEYSIVKKDAEVLSHSEKRVYTILEETFLSKFDIFKEKPDEFLTSLSHDIVFSLKKETTLIHDDIPVDQLRQALIRFLELCLGKLVWSPEEHEPVWDSVKSIAQSLEQLSQQMIIPDIYDLNDLFWSLIHRFCFFLDITGSDIPAHCYTAIQEDITQKQLLFLTLEEQEPCLETKLARLQRALREGETKKRAYENGILLS